MKIDPKLHYGTHLPVLMKAMSITDGPVVELGSGMFSTPYLHWECLRTNRCLTTYESKPDFYELFRKYAMNLHKIIFVTDWNNIDLSVPWSVALVDHSPGDRRGLELKKLTHVDYVVVHDMMNLGHKNYGYLEVLDRFKYFHRFKRLHGSRVYTGILSNSHDLREFTVLS